jgi:hypothetical protein
MRRLAGQAALVVSGLALGTLVVVPWPGSGAAAPRSGALTTSAHIAFEDCPAATTVLTVSIPRSSYSARQPVLATVTLANTSATNCGQSLNSPPPVQVPDQLSVGPCGPLGLEIFNAKGANIYPGNVAFPCPAEFGVELLAHARLRTTASWDQRASYNSTTLARRGVYRLRISQQLANPSRTPISFRIKLTGTTRGSLPTTTLPPQSGGPATVCPPSIAGSSSTPDCVHISPVSPPTPPTPGQAPTACAGTSATLISVLQRAVVLAGASARRVSAACPTPAVAPHQDTIPTIPSR